tara:strand:+ start:1206 stop:1370 length:165 start_codon:yes stop_codon:yes gene_type:complete
MALIERESIVIGATFTPVKGTIRDLLGWQLQMNSPIKAVNSNLILNILNQIYQL